VNTALTALQKRNSFQEPTVIDGAKCLARPRLLEAIAARKTGGRVAMRMFLKMLTDDYPRCALRIWRHRAVEDSRCGLARLRELVRPSA
jgi:hypothetical protein